MPHCVSVLLASKHSLSTSSSTSIVMASAAPSATASSWEQVDYIPADENVMLLYEIMNECHASHFKMSHQSNRRICFSKLSESSPEPFYVANVFENNRILATIHLHTGLIKCKQCGHRHYASMVSELIVPSEHPLSIPRPKKRKVTFTSETKQSNYIRLDDTDTKIEKTSPANTSSEFYMCRICDDNAIDCLIFPCKHVGMCSTCVSKVTSCPFCRALITTTIKGILFP